MIKQFRKMLVSIYQHYLQAILFVAGFVIVNVACYRINVTAGLFVTGGTLILFGIILNQDQRNQARR